MKLIMYVEFGSNGINIDDFNKIIATFNGKVKPIFPPNLLAFNFHKYDSVELEITGKKKEELEKLSIKLKEEFEKVTNINKTTFNIIGKGKNLVKLTATNTKQLNNVCNQLKEIAKKTGVELSGPIPFPTKKLVISNDNSPKVNIKETWNKGDLIHKRVIAISSEDRVMGEIMKLNIPYDVCIEVELKG